ncbi:MAG: glycosyltransferase [Flavobacteriales bacterium]|nr:glycosyltransferase [Flavobacteriales bacterium]
MSVRISIVTPSYQQAAFLEDCLLSVAGQEHAEVEHIVVDGGSTDGSVAILERNADRLAWWCSEKDAGQSDAINKGLARATGEVFGWLNSDDALLPGALQRVAQAFDRDPQLLVYGGQRVLRDDQGAERIAPLDDPSDPGRLHIAPMVNQQSTFFRLAAVRELGGVDPVLHYAMDHELWLRLLFRFGTEHLRFEAEPLAIFRVHGAMKSRAMDRAFTGEIAGILYGLCLNAGLADLAGILRIGHRWPEGMRSIPADKEHGALVLRMTRYFLLKWHHVIHRKDQFRMMRALSEMDLLHDTSLDGEERAWLATLRSQLRVPGWWAFRLRRKWRHLTR